MAALQALLQSQADKQIVPISNLSRIAMTYIPVTTAVGPQGDMEADSYARVVAGRYDLERSVEWVEELHLDTEGPFLVVSWDLPLGEQDHSAVIDLSRVPPSRMRAWMDYFRHISTREEVWDTPPWRLVMVLRDQVALLGGGLSVTVEAANTSAQVVFHD